MPEKQYPSWWLNRLGDVAAATVTPSQREPGYGLAADVAMTRSQFRRAVNRSCSRDCYLARSNCHAWCRGRCAGADAFEALFHDELLDRL